MYGYRIVEIAGEDEMRSVIAEGHGSERMIAAALRVIADEMDPRPAKPSFSDVFKETIMKSEAARAGKRSQDNGEKAGEEFMRDVFAGKRKMEDFGAFLVDFIKAEALREMPDVSEAEVEKTMREGGLLK